jgi:DnaK suppressor protein
MPTKTLPHSAPSPATPHSIELDRSSLTEAELLAMPDADYMNAAQMAFFRIRLSQLREELLDNAAATSQNLRQNETPADPNDRATVEEEHILELRVRDRERKLLGKINAALRRIDAGDYGYCEETGEPIGLRRLLARPTATLCVEAQERHERLQSLVAE